MCTALGNSPKLSSQMIICRRQAKSRKYKSLRLILLAHERTCATPRIRGGMAATAVSLISNPSFAKRYSATRKTWPLDPLSTIVDGGPEV